MKKDIENLINYAVKEGLIDDSASEWSDEEKEHYFQMCEAYS